MLDKDFITSEVKRGYYDQLYANWLIRYKLVDYKHDFLFTGDTVQEMVDEGAHLEDFVAFLVCGSM